MALVVAASADHRAHQQLTDRKAVKGEGERAEDHRPSFDRRVGAAFFPKREAERCERYRRRSAE